jgi:hypothetical protein
VSTANIKAKIATPKGIYVVFSVNHGKDEKIYFYDFGTNGPAALMILAGSDPADFSGELVGGIGEDSMSLAGVAKELAKVYSPELVEGIVRTVAAAL